MEHLTPEQSARIDEQWRQQAQNAAYQYQECLNQQKAPTMQSVAQQIHDHYKTAAQAQHHPLSGIAMPEPAAPTPEIPPMKPLKFVIFYALVAFGTFTWLYNHQEWGTSSVDRVDRTFLSGFGAAGWPLYWSGRAVFAADVAITAAVPRVTEWWNAPAPDTSPMCFNEATGETVRARNGYCRFSEKHSEGTSTGGLMFGTAGGITSGGVYTCTTGAVHTMPSAPHD